MLAKYRVLFTIVIVILILLMAAVAIFWARGFKPNFRDGKIERTGLIVATSIPTGAQVYLDDRLTSATDTNIAFLDPKTYKVKVAKDGYTTWEKDIEVKADLATEIRALLFPLAPEIKPLTTTGAASPTLSPDGSQIVYGVAGTRGGAFVVSMNERPFPFRQEVRQLAANKDQIDYSRATFLWSPDSKQIIARVADEDGQIIANLMLDAAKSDQEPNDVTAALTATLAGWQQDIDARYQTLTLTVPDEVKSATAAATVERDRFLSEKQSVESKSTTPQKDFPLSLSQKETVSLTLNYFPTGLNFSPDEEKILYLDKNQRHHIYDLKAKRDYTLPELPNLLNLSWYPDSAHLVVAQNNLISIIEIDGANMMTVYSGKFENGFVFAHPSGTKLIIATTLTQTEGSPPNLYSINLR